MSAPNLERSYLAALSDPQKGILALDRADAEESLIEFMRKAWPVLEPTRPLVEGWALEALCQHLEAVTKGDIDRLLINIPPGFTKSMTTRVFWPAWEWAFNPDRRFIGASYDQALATRDNVRMRRLINSDWYQERWGHVFALMSDQDAKMRFDNTRTGFSVATSVGGLGTGERGDRFLIDDPHNVVKAESKADREKAVRWFNETVPTRMNDPEKSAIVIIMQRVHEEDVSQAAIDLGVYEHLRLPMEYEAPTKKTPACHTSIGFTDPRTEDGELLCEKRYNRAKTNELKAALGTYGTASQLQQRPAPRGGGMFKAEKFTIVKAPPARVVSSVRYWDKAGTEGGGCFTAGVKMELLEDGRWLVSDVQHKQLGAYNREKLILQTAQADGGNTAVWVEQEPGSGGKESAEGTIRMLAGFAVQADKVTGSKELRAVPYSAQVEGGNVMILDGLWNRNFIDEHASFPRGKYADQVDAAAGAFAKLTGPRWRAL